MCLDYDLNFIYLIGNENISSDNEGRYNTSILFISVDVCTKEWVRIIEIIVRISR